MIDQLIIGNFASYDDFEANVKERKISAPKKKSIKETVPFSNETYDFTAINGEIYWEERILEYVFEITANTPEELEAKKQLFTSWVMNVMNEELHDPFILDYHFIATFDSIDIDDSEIEKSTIAAMFTAYPYMIANRKKSFVFEFGNNTEWITKDIVNESSHRLAPTITTDVAVKYQVGNTIFSIGAGASSATDWMLEPGATTVKAYSTNGKAGTLKIEFYEEVF